MLWSFLCLTASGSCTLFSGVLARQEDVDCLVCVVCVCVCVCVCVRGFLQKQLADNCTST